MALSAAAATAMTLYTCVAPLTAATRIKYSWGSFSLGLMLLGPNIAQQQSHEKPFLVFATCLFAWRALMPEPYESVVLFFCSAAVRDENS